MDTGSQDIQNPDKRKKKGGERKCYGATRSILLLHVQQRGLGKVIPPLKAAVHQGVNKSDGVGDTCTIKCLNIAITLNNQSHHY